MTQGILNSELQACGFLRGCFDEIVTASCIWRVHLKQQCVLLFGNFLSCLVVGCCVLFVLVRVYWLNILLGSWVAAMLPGLLCQATGYKQKLSLSAYLTDLLLVH